MATLYTYKWRQARARYLALHPLCTLCAEMGRTTPATVVDHIRPHRQNEVLFWDQNNWQAVCKPCHDGVCQVKDHTGQLRGSRADGLPLDPRHPWFREATE